MIRARRRPRASQRGFALIIVLWAVALLALLGASLTVVSRQHVGLSDNMVKVGAARAATDGAVQHAIFELLDGTVSRWRADGGGHSVRIGQVVVWVRMQDETNKVNPNVASVDQLRALFVRVSVDPAKASALAAAIDSWRSPDGGTTAGNGALARDDRARGTPFTRLDQLRDVPGMTPEILELVQPELTLYTDPDEDLSDLGDGPGAVRVVRIVAIARGPGDAMFARRVIARLNARRSGSRYEILASNRVGSYQELNELLGSMDAGR